MRRLRDVSGLWRSLRTMIAVEAVLRLIAVSIRKPAYACAAGPLGCSVLHAYRSAMPPSCGSAVFCPRASL